MVDSAPRVPHKRRLRSSTKIAVGFVAVVAAGYFGYRAWSNYMVGTISVTPIVPKRVNLIAIDPGAGYRILVANGIAQLAEVTGGLDTPDLKQVDDSDVVSAKKVPLKELLRSLQLDGKGLGAFVMRLNDIKDDDLPADAPVWPAADIEKAVKGDKALAAKLEHDLNIGLDGTPPNHVLASACINGIIISTPVTVNVGGAQVVGQVSQPFRPSFIESVERELTERFDADTARPGIYREKLAQLTSKEDVRRSLLALIGPDRQAELAAKPQRVLANAHVILNDDQIESASQTTYKTNHNRELSDVTIDLTDEGRQRLWKYSHDHRGFQLLLVVDGIAIAAPRISQELSQRQVTINQIPDPTLAREAVDLMNKKTSGGK